MIDNDTMTVATTEVSDLTQDKHILIALDETESSKRALLYVADFLGGFPGIRVTLLRIIPDPSGNYFENAGERAEWIKGQHDKAIAVLENYRDILTQSGFGRDKVSIKVNILNSASVAESILKVQREEGCCTVVVGRRAISRKMEFLFDRTTSKILRAEKRCALWVVE